MNEDAELLHQYAAEHSEAAFAELIRRHLDLVYSAALRLVNGDAHRAQDVAQLVFAEFARQARRLIRHPAPVGWLYTTTRLVALRVIRTEQRRSAREQEATTMNELLRESSPEPEWACLSPLLEEAMHELGEKDRHAVLLRFFQNKSLKEVGLALDLGENAARMRVDRALEKLRMALARRGVTATATLAAAISANAVQVAPAGMAATMVASSTLGAGTYTFFKIMTATQFKLGLGALVVAGVATALVAQHQTQQQLRLENGSLRQQVAQWQADSVVFSNKLAEAGEPNKSADDQLNELLKLRGEVGALRNQAAQLGKISQENQRLRARNFPPTQSVQVSPEDQFRLQEWHTIDTMKHVGLAIRLYTGGDQVVLVTNFDQITATSLYDTNRPGTIALDGLEFVNAGSLSYDHPEMIMFREKQPRRTLDGKWVREYGLVDGSVQTIYSADGNFDDYEKQHSPPNQN